MYDRLRGRRCLLRRSPVCPGVTTVWRRRAPGLPWSPAGRCCWGPARGAWTQTGGSRSRPAWTDGADTGGGSEGRETEALGSRRARHLEPLQPGSTHLKVLPRGEGEEGQLALLLAPGPTQVRVPDEHAWLDAGVEVEGHVLRPAAAQVHCKTEQDWWEAVGTRCGSPGSNGGVYLWGYTLTCPLIVMCCPGISPLRMLPL